MKILTPGHKYVAANFENNEVGQTIQFIEKTRKISPNPSEFNTELVTVNDGTTNEELLAVLIDRLKFLNEKFQCRENAIVITKLEESLMWLNKRTAERVSRNVEGKHVA